MGWVTLTLRKTELKRSHSDYQMELLQISRQKREMARKYHYEQTVARTEGNKEVRAAQTEYMNAFEKYRQDAKSTQGDGTSSEDYSKYDEIRDELESARLKYEKEKMDAQSLMEEELARLEEEANDSETQLDQQQVEVEAQLEAISAEMEAVGSAISEQIKTSTIKLA